MIRVLFTFTLLGIVIACGQQATEEATDGAFKHPDEIVNPNGDSELSIVMRYLHFEASKIKESLEKGEEVDYTEFNALIKRVNEAEPTDASVLDDEYYQFSKILIDNAHEMNSGSVEAFNTMLSSCVSCHRVTCPGPISKIEKLRITS